MRNASGMNQHYAQVGDERSFRFDNQNIVGHQTGSQTIHGHVFEGPVYIQSNEQASQSISALPLRIDTSRPAAAFQNFQGAHLHGEQALNGLLDAKEQREVYLRALRFEESQSRHASIKSAHAQTCGWLLDHPGFTAWLANDNATNETAFLWIKGKPATGKSTIMKFAFDLTKESKSDAYVVAFFFNARGTDLEKSTVGMYRSLVSQLLILDPDLEKILEDLPRLERRSRPVSFDVNRLVDLLSRIFARCRDRYLIFFVDALDECNEDQIREMVSDLQNLCSTASKFNVRIRICFSSRHYPYITIEDSIQLILDEQDDHQHDIERYLQSQLKIGANKKALEIRQQVLKRSGGIFLWVVLTIRILNQEYDRGRIHTLQKRLDTIPKGLDALFDEMLGRDGEPQAEMVLCLQWVLYAIEPLSPQELYYAILSGTEPEDISTWDSENIGLEDMERFIIDCSKGFIETTNTTTKRNRVQFIHESVRDYFLLGSGLQRQCFGPPTTFAARSHDRLVSCCRAYYLYALNLMHLPSEISMVYDVPVSHFASMHEKASALPFMLYAHKNILKHADIAQQDGIPQDSLLESFPVAGWWNLNRILVPQSEPASICTREISLLLIVSNLELPNLVQLILTRFQSYPITDDEEYPAINAICSANCKGASLALLKPAKDDIQHGHDTRQGLVAESEVQLLFSPAFRDRLQRSEGGVLTVLSGKGSNAVLEWFLSSLYAQVRLQPRDFELALEVAASHGQAATIEILLTHGVDVNAGGGSQTALHAASVNGHMRAAKVLLARGADVNLRYGLYGTPLHGAALKGRLGMVKLLLNHGANIDGPYGHEGSVLMASVQCGDSSIIRLLLEHGANVNAPNEYNITVLQLASLWNQPTTVQMLIDYGAEVNDLLGPFGTALHISATFGYVEPLDILLQYGADVNTLDRAGMTALQVARERGFEEIVDMLFVHSAE